jgi:uncharacterized membrane protein
MSSWLRAWFLTACLVGGAVAFGWVYTHIGHQKSLQVRTADIDIVVLDDGSLDVTEILSIFFEGTYEATVLNVPLRVGESIGEVHVSEGSSEYGLGGCTKLGCSSPSGLYGYRLYGSESSGYYARVVWHHDSTDTERTFTLKYRLWGFTTAYDDVADVLLKVWEDGWDRGVERLSARIHVPGEPLRGDVRAWAHLNDLDVSASLGSDGVSPALTASDIPGGRWVELRSTFPVTALASTSGARVVGVPGIKSILAEEDQLAGYGETVHQNRRRGVLGGIAALLFMGVLGLVIFMRYGKEPRVDYDLEYETVRPSDLPPAEAGALLSGVATGKEFSATMFDLVRQGVIIAEVGEGTADSPVPELELRLGSEAHVLRPFEEPVFRILERVLSSGAVALSTLPTRVSDDAKEKVLDYQAFQTEVRELLVNDGLIDTSGSVVAAIVAIVAGALAVVGFFSVPALLGSQPGGVFMGRSITAGLFVGALLLGSFMGMVPGSSTKRTQRGALEAARWNAYRRYLEDITQVEEAPVGSIAVWERVLIDAIALGIADAVLESARHYAPSDIESSSTMRWYDWYETTDDPSFSVLADLGTSLSGAFSAESSEIDGGGDGGDGGGGGGGGW